MTIGRTNSGSGGILSANAAVLQVSALVGSTVTISSGGSAKTQDASKAHILVEDGTRAIYIFSVPASMFGTCTVTVTRGNYTQTRTILISSPELYSMTVTVNIADEYQEVEYIRGTGAAYAKLDFTTPEKCGFELDALLNNRTDYQNLFGGSVYGQGSQLQYFEVHDRHYVPKDGTSVTYPSVFTVRHKYYYKYNGSSYNYGYDNVLTGTSSIEPIQNAQIGILTYVDPNGTPRSANIATASIYGMKYFSGLDEYANLIPCYRKSDSVSGLFETHRGTFYRSYTSTNFIVGADVE